MKDILNFKDIIASIKTEKKFLLVVIAVTFLLYANAIRGEFVTADDIPGIVENPITKDLGASLKTVNLSIIKNAVIYQVAGMNPNVFHLVSILIHLLNIALVFVFVRTLYNDKVAKIATMIFALHPVNAETVIWISGIPYAINAIFALIIFTLFVLYKKTSVLKYFIFSVITYLLMVVHDKGAWALVVPFIIVIIDQFLFSDNINIKKALITTIPFLIIALISAYVIVGKNYSGRVAALTSQYYFDPTQAPPLLNRIPFTIYMGTKNLVIPYELNIYPGEKEITIGEYRFIWALTWAFILLVIYLWKNKRDYAGLVFAILAGVGPTFSPIQVAWLMTERYMYVSSIFFAIIIGLIATNIHKKQIQKSNIAIAGILVLFAIRIVLRTEDWRTNKNLWLSTLIFSPESYRVYNNLGDVYMKETNYDKAIESFKKSFELFPQYADAMHNLAIVYMVKQDTINAKKYMQMAVKTKPTLVPAWEKLGLIYLQEKEYDIAQVQFLEALKIDPNAALAKEGLQKIKEEKASYGLQ
jgi:protein O-mannosyl-transferase